MASDVRYREVKKALEAKAYFLHRIRGSHHTFKKQGVGSYSFPVHGGKVKAVYVRQIEKLS